ncbi:MAG: TlpA family protein disulfide reductase [Rhodospirillales bacterium]|nr:TlpA family protein disulfide reductase [Rhodospirillales bacterium]
MPREPKTLFLMTCLLAVTMAAAAHGQSKARAPVLDAELKQAINAMQPLTATPPPKLTGKPLLITFFASWCPPCRPEFAELNALRRLFPPEILTLVAINLFEGHFEDPGGVRMKRFLGTTVPDFAVLRPRSEAEALRLFGNVDRIPTLYLYDGSGRPRHTFIHQPDAAKTHITAAELTQPIQNVLAAP